jgi:hypothetical protein
MTSPSFTIIKEGEEDGYSGTSASTLAAAAVIMLLDDYIYLRANITSYFSTLSYISKVIKVRPHLKNPL